MIGSARRNKHEKKSSDSWVSITIYRTGGVYGDTGPTAFVMQWGKHEEGYNEVLLNKFGAM